jgi:hypothetical protein
MKGKMSFSSHQSVTIQPQNKSVIYFFASWQATLVKYTTDEFDQRILYEYLAEASVVFPKVFPVV